MGLAENAAALAGREPDPVDTDRAHTEPEPELDMSDYEIGDGDPEMVPVHLAWLRVRRDVGSIAKKQRYNQGGTKFDFRGFDTVVNAFAPVTMRHGVHVLPTRVVAEHRDVSSAKGNRMHECTVTVTWLVMGPMGDTLPPLQTCGEALDAADKATAKALTVAMRELLTKGGLVPTHDADPDSSYIERGEAPARSAESYRDEMLDPKTSVDRLNTIRVELRGLGMLNARVMNETGDQETLDSIGGRMYMDRTGGAA